MITVQDDLRIARDRYVSALVAGECDVADQWRATSMRLAYSVGELSPNFPMPAVYDWTKTYQGYVYELMGKAA